MSCKGRFYRCRVNTYVSQGVYVCGFSMRPLKRMSCPGCQHCGFLDDDLHEYVHGWDRTPLVDSPKDGGTYELKAVNISHDWETGIVDDYDLQFVEVK